MLSLIQPFGSGNDLVSWHVIIVLKCHGDVNHCKKETVSREKPGGLLLVSQLTGDKVMIHIIPGRQSLGKRI